MAAYKRHCPRERSTRVRRVHWLGRWRARIEVWLENHKARRELRRCASLDPRFARDIGFSSDELAVVCAAPPWKAVTRPPSSLERGPSVDVQDLPGTVRQHHAVDCFRRVSPVAPRPREGPLTEPTAGAQPWPRERVLMPHLHHSPTAARPSQVGRNTSQIYCSNKPDDGNRGCSASEASGIRNEAETSRCSTLYLPLIN